MQPGRLRSSRPARPSHYKNHGPITTAAQLELARPTPPATTEAAHVRTQIERTESDHATIAAQPPAVVAAVRASISARLRKRGYTPRTAYAAHAASVAGRPHDAAAAAAWRAAIAAAIALLRPTAAP